jgi:hypothetical protein
MSQNPQIGNENAVLVTGLNISKFDEHDHKPSIQAAI